jgi:hypothetical protein
MGKNLVKHWASICFNLLQPASIDQIVFWVRSKMIGHQEWMVPSHPNPVINPIVSSHLGAHAIHTLVNSTMFYFTSFYHGKSSRQNLDIIKLCLGCT